MQINLQSLLFTKSKSRKMGFKYSQASQRGVLQLSINMKVFSLWQLGSSHNNKIKLHPQENYRNRF